MQLCDYGEVLGWYVLWVGFVGIVFFGGEFVLCEVVLGFVFDVLVEVL